MNANNQQNHIVLMDIECHVCAEYKKKTNDNWMISNHTGSYSYSTLIDTPLTDSSDLHNWVNECKEKACHSWILKLSNSLDYDYRNPVCYYVKYEKVMVIS